MYICACVSIYQLMCACVSIYQLMCAFVSMLAYVCMCIYTYMYCIVKLDIYHDVNTPRCIQLPDGRKAVEIMCR